MIKYEAIYIDSQTSSQRKSGLIFFTEKSFSFVSEDINYEIPFHLITISSGVGLQKTIQNKISSFFGHMSISNFQNNSSQSSLQPILIDQDFYRNQNNKDITHIQAVAYKSGLIVTKTTFEGVIFKGIGSDYNYDIFNPYLIEGEIPLYNDEVSNEVIISQFLSERLSIK